MNEFGILQVLFCIVIITIFVAIIVLIVELPKMEEFHKLCKKICNSKGHNIYEIRPNTNECICNTATEVVMIK